MATKLLAILGFAKCNRLSQKVAFLLIFLLLISSKKYYYVTIRKIVLLLKKTSENVQDYCIRPEGSGPAGLPRKVEEV